MSKKVITKAHAGQNVDFEILRDNQTMHIQPKLRPPGSKDGYLGVFAHTVYKIKYGVVGALATSAGISLQLIRATLGAFGNLIAGLFIHGKVTDQVTGPVGIVVVLNNIINFGASYVLIFVASISISLAVVNAMPLPALDGGRWLLVFAQKITRRQLSAQMESAVHAAGFVALIALMLVITFFDIKRFG